MTDFVALDLGYGHTKGISKGREIVIPSVVGSAHDLFTTDLAEIQPLSFIRDIKRNRFIGDLALRQSAMRSFSLDEHKALSDNTLALMETSMALLAGSRSNINIISGIPVTFFNHQREEFKNLIEGEHTIDIMAGDKHYTNTITVDRAILVPQPLGSAMDFVLNNEGEIKRDVANTIKGTIGVLDVGFYTSDMLLLDNMEIVHNHSRSLKSGLSVALKAMNDAGIDLPLYSLDKAIREGKYARAKDKAYSALAEQISMEVRTYWSEAKPDIIIVTGGGGSALHGYFDLQTTTFLAGQMSNVRGYHKMGRRSLR